MLCALFYYATVSFSVKHELYADGKLDLQHRVRGVV